uniref:Uncharacterized protein n=1 Tax=Oryza glumipatula TaxID=40148 RepID=A0A0E0B8I5_9ORYZ
MSESEEKISLSDNEIDPTELYTMDDYLQQRNAWNAAAAQLAGHLMMMSSLEASSSRQQRGLRRTVRRDRVGGNARIVADYFCDNPVYNEVDFLAARSKCGSAPTSADRCGLARWRGDAGRWRARRRARPATELARVRARACRAADRQLTRTLPPRTRHFLHLPLRLQEPAAELHAQAQLGKMEERNSGGENEKRKTKSRGEGIEKKKEKVGG